MENIKHKNKSRNIATTHAIIGGFALTILFGTILLMTPFASRSGNSTDFLTCLFTSTSAMCVTGLVVVDTATHWSFFGQLIILILIQLGGMGIILVASMITIISGQKINLSHRATLQEALAVDKVGGIIKLTKFILNAFAISEILGAIILFTNFIHEFDLPNAIWNSIFHSISAFCNAGFDIMGFKGHYSSLTSYSHNLVINITIMLLIVIGGIGFTVWDDIFHKRFKFSKYALQSKIVIISTLILILLPAIYFFNFEYTSLGISDRILPSLFQSITTRTAGFNTTNFSDMSEVGKAITIILMFIGGSPCSTAGGIKTTTVAILIISCIAMYRRQNEPHIFYRKIKIQTIKNAITIFVSYLVVFITVGCIICKIENITLLESIFETSSAIGTVGLSLGHTPFLSNISRVLIIFLMFFGRIGGLTFIYAIIPSLNDNSRYISEDIQVG